MLREPAIAVVSVLVIVTSIFLLFVSPAIHKWERDNHYPFGRLCDLYRNCR